MTDKVPATSPPLTKPRFTDRSTANDQHNNASIPSANVPAVDELCHILARIAARIAAEEQDDVTTTKEDSQ